MAGEKISQESRDRIRPFAEPLGELTDVFHCLLLAMEIEELEGLERATQETLNITQSHGSGKFHLAATILKKQIPGILDWKRDCVKEAEHQEEIDNSF